MVLTSAAASLAETDAAQIERGPALVGVDELGRVLVAMDSHGNDGIADCWFLFTAPERLAGPWSRFLPDAMAIRKRDSLWVQDQAGSFSLHLAIAGSGVPKAKIPGANRPGAETFQRDDGIELVMRDDDGETGTLIAAVTIEDLTLWPEDFWYDLLDPASCTGSDNDCTAGGVGASSCSIAGCGYSDNLSCSVTCVEGTFACCKCASGSLFGFASCRCRFCQTVPT